MTRDHRITWGLIGDVLSVLERHGYHKYDNQHTGRAIGVMPGLAEEIDPTITEDRPITPPVSA